LQFSPYQPILAKRQPRRILRREVASPEESALANGTAGRHAARAREHLLLRLSGSEDLAEDPIISYFTRHLGDDWMRSRSSEFAALRKDWRTVERMSIGANYHLVSRRLDRTQQQRADLIVDKGQMEVRNVLVSYLRQLLDRIVQSSTKLWFPLAAAFIKSGEWPRHSLRKQRRVPIALRLRVPLPPISHESAEPIEYREVDELLDDWGDGDEKAGRILDAEHNPLFIERQHFVFAVAATMALRMGLWSQAERYADLASSAAEVAEVSAPLDSAERHDKWECFYLKALAIRFRIGAFPPHRSTVTENVWRKWLDSAVIILDRCVAYHAAPAPGDRHVLRELRAVSERAAIRLFYAAWVAVARSAPLPFFTVEDAYGQFQAATLDLRRCLELEADGRAAAERDDMRAAFFDRLERQYVTNSAAAEVIAHLFANNHGFSIPDFIVDENGPVMRRILEWSERAETLPLPPVACVDLAAFLVFRYKNPTAKNYLGRVAGNPPALTLAIDQAILRAIVKVLFPS